MYKRASGNIAQIMSRNEWKAPDLFKSKAMIRGF